MITVLAGGVGAARLLAGMVEIVEANELKVIVNTGDDLERHGLYVCPDLDTITYTLAKANAETGWGLAGETFNVLSALERYGEPTWFALGDRDLATHLFRTRRLREGASLKKVTAEIAAAWGLGLELLPMSNDSVRTRLLLREGREVAFQEYFVKLGHNVAVESIRFAGAESADPAPGVLEAIERADVIVIAPSNPLVSIGPILSVPGLRQALTRRRERVVAISPIVAGRALKGPADRLLVELGFEASVTGVASVLHDVAGTLVIDTEDARLVDAVRAMDMEVLVTSTVMHDQHVAMRLSQAAISLVSDTSSS